MARMEKNLPATQESQVQPWAQEDPLRRECLPTPGSLPGESQGQKSLVGYRPWGGKELDTTERLTHTQPYFPLSRSLSE